MRKIEYSLILCFNNNFETDNFSLFILYIIYSTERSLYLDGTFTNLLDGSNKTFSIKTKGKTVFFYIMHPWKFTELSQSVGLVNDNKDTEITQRLKDDY